MGLLARALRRVRPWTLLLAVVPAFLLSGCFGPEAPAAPAAGAVRGEKDKTPFPCKESYTDDEIKSFVDTHLRDAKGGHSEPQLLLMLGGSGAGKGTFIDKWTSAERQSKAPAHPLSGFVFHGLDEYLPYIPEYVKSVNDKAFVYKDAADACYKPAAIPAAKLAGDRIVNNRLDLIYEETGKSMDRIVKRVLPPFTKAGYRITTVLVHNKPEIAIGRAAGRFQKTGRYAADDYINGTFANNLETYMGLQKVDGLSEFVYCDNSAKEIRCWQDRAVGGKLVPSSVLLDGPPVYMGSKPQAKPAAKPAAKEPAAKKPAAKKPAAKEPAAKEPAAKKPAAKEPAAKQPAAKKPAAKEPAAKQPAAKKPAAKEPAAKEPAAKKPAAKKPAAKEPPAKKPAAKEPAAKKPAAKKPAAKEPAAKPAAGKGRGAEL